MLGRRVEPDGWVQESEEQNMVILDEHGWEKLEETMEALLADPVRAERIAENAWRTLHGRCVTVPFCLPRLNPC